FSVPVASLAEPASASAGVLTISLRPQSIRLHAARPNGAGTVALAGRIVSRAFLGETWDYVFAAGNGGPTLKVSAPPSTVVEFGAEVWAELDPQQMVPIV